MLAPFLTSIITGNAPDAPPRILGDSLTLFPAHPFASDLPSGPDGDPVAGAGSGEDRLETGAGVRDSAGLEAAWEPVIVPGADRSRGASESTGARLRRLDSAVSAWTK